MYPDRSFYHTTDRVSTVNLVINKLSRLMKHDLIPVLLIMLLGSACHSAKQPPVAGENKIAVADTGKFFPITAFFKDQIQYVDLRDFPIYQIQTKDGKRDSTVISKEEFAQLAGIFLERSLSEPGIKSRYKETVFEDLSTGSITLNYTPLSDTETVQHIDILLDNQTRIVKRIFIRSVFQQGDTVVNEQCNWKANKSFQINRNFSFGKGKNKHVLNFINWNDKP